MLSQTWLVGWFGVQRPFETVFQSISGRLPKRGRKRKERIDESKKVHTTPTRTYCNHSRPLPYCNPNCRTPRHWKFTQHLRTTRPPPLSQTPRYVRISNRIYPTKSFPQTSRIPHRENNAPQNRDLFWFSIKYLNIS